MAQGEKSIPPAIEALEEAVYHRELHACRLLESRVLILLPPGSTIDECDDVTEQYLQLSKNSSTDEAKWWRSLCLAPDPYGSRYGSKVASMKGELRHHHNKH